MSDSTTWVVKKERVSPSATTHVFGGREGDRSRNPRIRAVTPTASIATLDPTVSARREVVRSPSECRVPATGPGAGATASGERSWLGARARPPVGTLPAVPSAIAPPCPVGRCSCPCCSRSPLRDDTTGWIRLRPMAAAPRHAPDRPCAPRVQGRPGSAADRACPSSAQGRLSPGAYISSSLRCASRSRARTSSALAFSRSLSPRVRGSSTSSYQSFVALIRARMCLAAFTTSSSEQVA